MYPRYIFAGEVYYMFDCIFYLFPAWPSGRCPTHRRGAGLVFTEQRARLPDPHHPVIRQGLPWQDHGSVSMVTLSPPNKLSSAEFLVCSNFQSASLSLKIGENIVWVSNSLNPGETPSYAVSHPDPSYLYMALYLWVVGCGLIWCMKLFSTYFFFLIRLT